MTLELKQARSRFINREQFVDWNKLMDFVRSSSLVLAKINLDKIRTPQEASEKYKFRGKRERKNSIAKELEVSASRDFDFNSKEDGFEIQFEEI